MFTYWIKRREHIWIEYLSYTYGPIGKFTHFNHVSIWQPAEGERKSTSEKKKEKREEEKARIRVLPLIFFFADNDTVHSTLLFEWYSSLSFPLSFSLNYDGGLHSVLQITD